MKNNLSNSKLVNATRSSDSRTLNDAVTHSTSLSNIVDMFFLAGASRTMSEDDIRHIFSKALAEDPILAVKCLFWARDIRGGAGERRFFRICFDYLRKTQINAYFLGIEKLIPEYGRWDDVWYERQIDADLLSWLSLQIGNGNGLLCKWLPRKGKLFEALRKYLSFSPKELRKLLVNGSNTVEQKMCAKQWNEIEYPHVPSVAMHKYRKAFKRNDESRFDMFLSLVEKGEVKIHADAIFPHTLVKQILEGRSSYGRLQNDPAMRAVDAQWQALPNYMEGSKEKIIPVCDTSGSMTSPNYLPISVSVALGLYISERNESVFKDAFITFSGKPTMQYIKSGPLFSRVHQLMNAEWEMNTNLQAVFDLILSKGKNNSLTEEDMPTKILIISDMEFDAATNTSYRYHRNQYDNEETNFEAIERKYRDAGYKRPQIVFWNVNGRVGNCPVQIGKEGTALVSGFSPAILKDILKGDLMTPEKFVLRVLSNDRYKPIEKCFE